MPNSACSDGPSHIAESIGRIRRQVESFACLPRLPRKPSSTHAPKRRAQIKDPILFRRCRELLSGTSGKETA